MTHTRRNSRLKLQLRKGMLLGRTDEKVNRLSPYRFLNALIGSIVEVGDIERGASSIRVKIVQEEDGTPVEHGGEYAVPTLFLTDEYFRVIA